MNPVIVATIFVGAWLLSSASAPGQTVGVRPVPHQGVLGAKDAGNVWRKANGKEQILTRDGLATNVKTAPDGTIAWVEGQMILYPNKDLPVTAKGYPKVPTYFPAAIRVWKNGKRLCRIVPEKLAEVEFVFVKGGRQIAVGSAGMHGPCYQQLFEAKTGRLLERHAGYEEKIPEWAKAVKFY